MDGSLTPIITNAANEVSGGLVKSIGATLSDVWQRIVGDRVQAWRMENAAKISETLVAQVAARGLVLKFEALPAGYAFRWFDKASEEERPEIQALFATLLANAAIGNEDALQRHNIELVSRMTPNAAQFLVLIKENYVEFLRNNRISDPRQFKNIDKFSMKLNHFKAEFNTDFDLLISMGVIRRRDHLSIDRQLVASIVQQGNSPSESALARAVKIATSVAITPLAVSLMVALFGAFEIGPNAD
jgi:hypothetical protein